MHDKYSCRRNIIWGQRRRLVYEAICWKSHWWMTTHWNVPTRKTATLVTHIRPWPALPPQQIYSLFRVHNACIHTKVFMVEISSTSTLNWIRLRLKLRKALLVNKLLTDLPKRWGEDLCGIFWAVLLKGFFDDWIYWFGMTSKPDDGLQLKTKD